MPKAFQKTPRPLNIFLALTLFLFPIAAASSLSAQTGLQSGPMVGYSQMLEVQLWLQTDGPESVVVRYWPIDAPGQVRQTEEIRTQRSQAYVAKPLADQVEPSTRYAYEVVLGGKVVEIDYPLEFQTQKLWQRGRSQPPNFRVAMGSCLFINDTEYPDGGDKPYGGGYGILTKMHERRPDVMLWLGDNSYLREVEWHSRTGMLRRYTSDRSLPELQPLLGSTHHYAVWDDHDAGPNNTHRAQWNLDVAQEAFELFWGNPSFGVPSAPGGLTTYFQWGDIDFFLLDNRSFRTPNERLTEENTLLGKEQIRWLIDNLVMSKAPFKVIAMGGQIINGAEAHETYINLAPAERDYILRTIRAEGVTGVIFVNGDRHHTELSRYGAWGFPPIYELTVSPLTAGTHPTAAAGEPNPYRVDGTIITKRNFGLMEFSGPRGERSLHITTVDGDGQEIWTRTITEKELRTPLPDRPRGSGSVHSPNEVLEQD